MMVQGETAANCRAGRCPADNLGEQTDMLGEGLSGGEIGLRAVWGAGGEGLQAGGLWGF